MTGLRHCWGTAMCGSNTPRRCQDASVVEKMLRQPLAVGLTHSTPHPVDVQADSPANEPVALWRCGRARPRPDGGSRHLQGTVRGFIGIAAVSGAAGAARARRSTAVTCSGNPIVSRRITGEKRAGGAADERRPAARRDRWEVSRSITVIPQSISHCAQPGRAASARARRIPSAPRPTAAPSSPRDPHQTTRPAERLEAGASRRAGRRLRSLSAGQG